MGDASLVAIIFLTLAQWSHCFQPGDMQCHTLLMPFELQKT